MTTPLERFTTEEKAKTESRYQFYLDAMIYQIVKQIGSAATVLKGEVEAILLTGGIAHSDYVVEQISDYCRYLAPIKAYPGGNEMDALAFGVLEILEGREEIKVFQPKSIKATLAQLA